VHPQEHFVDLVVQIRLANSEPPESVPHVVELGVEQAVEVDRRRKP
jgi:hypothetical protein